ncbi:MAG: peptidoglycan recognition protein family protein [Acidimicrobiia bacterium]
MSAPHRASGRFRALVRVPALGALAVVAATAVVAMPGQEGPPPEVTAEAIDLAQPAVPLAPGWTGEADVDPELVGIEWQGEAQASFTIETRDQSGAWSPAGTVEAQPRDEGPDEGSADAANRPAANVSEPLWVGDDVTGVRVHLDAGTAADVDLHAVDSPPAGAPDGSAVAAGGPILVGEGVDGAPRLIALVVLAAAGLGLALALTHSPRPSPRRRRRLVGAVAVASLGLGACVAAPPPPPTGSAPDGMITRAAWGANEGLRTANCPGGPDYMSSVRFAVVHHTVNSNSYAASQGPQLLRGIYGYHTQSLGYCDIAYNFLIDRYGNVYEGRYGGAGNAVMGAHALGFNTSSTGIALIGDFRTAVPPDPAIAALERVLAWKLGVHGINPKANVQYTTSGNEKWAKNSGVTVPPITYHGYTGFTECPGTQVINRMDQIRAVVAQQMGY